MEMITVVPGGAAVVQSSPSMHRALFLSTGTVFKKKKNKGLGI